MKYSPLADVLVLDFSHRLPGPLSTAQLSHLGAKVIKVEDLKFGDPFDAGAFDEMDSSFSDWYQTLNQSKEILKLNLQKDHEKVASLVTKADIILMGLPAKVQSKYSLLFEDCQKLSRSGAYLEMTSSRNKAFGMHDLNALAQSNLLELHIKGSSSTDQWIAPPFLPVAGITFASHLATECLAAHLQSLKAGGWVRRTVAMEEAVENLMVPLYSKKLKESEQQEFLHNGRYPCYAIYPLKDKGHLAVASVELKYWQRFCEAFKIELAPQERFSNDKRVFKIIAQELSQYSFERAQTLCENLDACVSLTGP